MKKTLFTLMLALCGTLTAQAPGTQTRVEIKIVTPIAQYGPPRTVDIEGELRATMQRLGMRSDSGAYGIEYGPTGYTVRTVTTVWVEQQ